MRKFPEALTLYGTLNRGTEYLLSTPVTVQYQAVKKVKLVDTWVHDNGYETNLCGVYQDAQGRQYRQHITIDWTGNTYYLRSDGVFFNTRPPSNARNILTLEPL